MKQKQRTKVNNQPSISQAVNHNNDKAIDKVISKNSTKSKSDKQLKAVNCKYTTHPVRTQ